jgi:hypothetical protein
VRLGLTMDKFTFILEKLEAIEGKIDALIDALAYEHDEMQTMYDFDGNPIHGERNELQEL